MLRADEGDATGDWGPYRRVRLLGSGGMGTVYLAERRDGEIQQKVAVKVLGGGNRPVLRERFLKERRLLALLSHPSIVHVIDAGHTSEHQPYLVMEYVEGVPIDTYAARIAVPERLKLFLRVCEGVSHAHRHLIIHRDLKPSNILVDASGQPKLLDFGIAKLLDDTGEPTETVERLLTPNYASPEQLRGGSQTTATDVYSLGAVLYKLLTGRSPHETGNTATALEVITGARQITPPTRLNSELPADLDYILRKALRTEPEERYTSVDAFADDVRALLD
jgi:serine/threonine-protein kinase